MTEHFWYLPSAQNSELCRVDLTTEHYTRPHHRGHEQDAGQISSNEIRSATVDIFNTYCTPAMVECTLLYNQNIQKPTHWKYNLKI